MHVTFVSTFPPKACGIATFTGDLVRAARGQSAMQANVVAVDESVTGAPAGGDVAYTIRRDEPGDYVSAAEFINYTGTDVVCVQHEFGIFGGSEGAYALELMRRLTKPVVTTLHTVLMNPSAAYHRALLAVASASDQLVVMSEKARSILQEVYGIAPERAQVVHHGVPSLPFEKTACYKPAIDADGRTVLMTFGLLGPGKGIEDVLEALPSVVRVQPDALYIVLGATHPEVKKQKGEAYRRRLQRRVGELGLEEHVRFVDEYVDDETLHTYLGACDVYVTPYPGRDQICSGTLAYAVGAGKAIVSTPYLYAEELLADGRGRLVDFGDAAAMREALGTLAADDGAREALRARAYAFGQQMTWPRVAEGYQRTFEAAAQRARVRHSGASSAPRLTASLRANLDYLAAITDDTGIFQHVAYGTPDRRHGYCTDDAARALVVALAQHRRTGERRALRLARTYLSFLHHAQRSDGRFRNVMDYTRCFVDERGTEDTVGRALWGLGAAVAYGPDAAMRVMARQMTEHALRVELTHPRALAYAIGGLSLFLERYAGAAEVRRALEAMADRLAEQYHAARNGRWHWFHDAFTYANAKIPQAMLLAHKATGNDVFGAIGIETLDFLTEQTYRDGQFDFIGNRGWYRHGAKRAVYDQQPIEAGYMAEACAAAYEITGAAHYREHARAAVEWLLGRNRLGLPLYDPATGACADGLRRGGVNMNQGAESVVAALLGLLAVADLAEEWERGRPVHSQQPALRPALAAHERGQ